MVKLILLVINLIFIIQHVLSVYKTVCDCSQPQTQGLLDLDEPPNCYEDKTYPSLEPHTLLPRTFYELMTRTRPDIYWTAYSCSQWIETKTITGSFWVGSFDTVYTTTTKEVEPSECWKMVHSSKCGSNTMSRDGKHSSFTQKPIGDGYWYSTTSYKSLNCMVQEITLRQEGNDDIISPFGILKTNISSEHFTINHNTIVWQSPGQPIGQINRESCNLQSIVMGVGRVSAKSGRSNGRLVDPKKQIEVIFNLTKLSLCEEDRNINLYNVIGLPETYLSISTSNYIPKNLTTKTKKRRAIPANINNQTKLALENGSRLYGISYSWGIMLNKDPKIDFAFGQTWHPHLLTSYDEGQAVNTMMMSNEDAKSIASNGNQNFEHIIDQTIRVQDTNLCLTADNSSFITIRQCSRTTSRWIHDVDNQWYIEEKSVLCLTKNFSYVILSECEIGNILQKWQQSEVNINPIIHDTHPKLTLSDIEFSHAYLSENPVEIAHGHDNSTYNWGQLFTVQDNAKLCVTVPVDGKQSAIKVETCNKR